MWMKIEKLRLDLNMKYRIILLGWEIIEGLCYPEHVLFSQTYAKNILVHAWCHFGIFSFTSGVGESSLKMKFNYKNMKIIYSTSRRGKLHSLIHMNTNVRHFCSCYTCVKNFRVIYF